MKSIIPEIYYYDYETCKLCGGKCCQNMAGIYIPDDFDQDITVEFIVSLLNTGKFAIDWLEADPTGGDMSRVLYIRPRHKEEPEIYPSWGGECINWTKEKGWLTG